LVKSVSKEGTPDSITLMYALKLELKLNNSLTYNNGATRRLRSVLLQREPGPFTWA